MTTLVLAVAGAGPANKAQIYDELGDWLGYGAPDADGYLTRARKRPYEKIKLILPLTDELFSPGVTLVYKWSGDAEIDYDGVIHDQEPAGNKIVKGAKAQAADLVTAPDVLDALIEELAEQDGDEKILLVCQDEDGTDPDAARATELAWQAGIEVRNLSFALAPLAAPEPPAGQDEAPAPGEDAEGATTTVTFLRSTDMAVDLTPALDAERESVLKMCFGTLGDVIHLLIAHDTANALQLGLSGVGPLTRDLVITTAALQRLLDYPGPVELRSESAPAAAAAPAPAAKGKVRREFRDPESGEWRPVGRGRPRKDVEIREVPLDAAADA